MSDKNSPLIHHKLTHEILIPQRKIMLENGFVLPASNQFRYQQLLQDLQTQ
ncbi:hypothetical protein ACKLNO_06770 [Neisseriaceae bacterium B1]